MNGYEAASAVRALENDKGSVPILTMTANAFDEDIKKAREAGMDGHVSKPIDMRLLIQKISEVVSHKRKKIYESRKGHHE